LYQNIIR